ncbi:MAG: ATP-binding protein, partial [Candidatus Latescibacteria bacterium]|nr:ATP-binding protein [Candidatus Latescibacterota bacterium]
RKEDVYEIINTVGAQSSIERIRIFNKEGRIMFSTDRTERGKAADKKAEACTRCHIGDQPVSRLEGKELTRTFQAADGHRVLGLITPVYNEPTCAGQACHPGPEEQQVLGVLDVQMSLAGIDSALKDQDQRFRLLTYVLMLIIASTCGAFLWRFVHVPVQTLIQGTEQVAKGNLDHRIPIRSQTEIGRLASSFNQMAEELGRAREQITDWTQTLAQRVEEKTRSLRDAQAKLVQSEKMASLGALSAAVAHEINNPLSGVLTYTRLLSKIVGRNGPDPGRVEDIQKYLDSMESEVARCGKIVGNLLEFSRQSGIVVTEVGLNGLVEKALFLVEHRLEMQEIRLAREMSSGLPDVVCDADQIQQAILAILINAVEAMPDGGTLKVTTRRTGDLEEVGAGVEIDIADTGVGIPRDVLPRLFEPFFTTKQDKKGVGLGLSVAYGIVRRHQGRIDVRSDEGQGTTFVIGLPERPQMQEEALGAGLSGAQTPGQPEEGMG